MRRKIRKQKVQVVNAFHNSKSRLITSPTINLVDEIKGLTDSEPNLMTTNITQKSKNDQSIV